MTDRLTLCAFWLLLTLTPVGCAPDGRPPREAPDRSGLGAENLPAAVSPEHTGEYSEALRKLAQRSRRPRGPLDKEVTFSFLGTTLGEAAAAISKLVGDSITIVSDPEAAEPLHKRRVSLTVQKMRLAGALDWVMRLTDAYYTHDGAGVCISSRAGARFPGKLLNHMYPLRTMRLYDVPVAGIENIESEKDVTLKCVKEILREYLKSRTGSKIVMGPQREGFVALCSENAHRRIAEVLREIARGKEKTPPLGPPSTTKEIEKKLEQVTFCAFRDRPVLEILSKLSVQNGLSIGVDPRELPKGLKTRITVHYGKASLRFTLQRIVKLCGLKGYEIEPGRGVWLHGDRPYPAEARSLWETGVIRSYYVEPLVNKIGVEKVMKLVGQNVTPDRWADGLPAMAYSPTGRLIVLHTRDAHAALSSYLYILEQAISAGRITKEKQKTE